MSRIIKSSVWGEPVVVEAPPPPAPPVEEVPEDIPDASEEDSDEELNLALELEEKRRAAEEKLAEEMAEAKREADEEIRRARDAADEEIRRAMEEMEKAREALMNECRDRKKEAEKALSDAKTDAAVMRADAARETKAILEDAHEQARHIMEDAKKEGHEKGHAEGREEGIRQVRDEEKGTILAANAKAEKTLADAKEECRVYVRNAENEIASLAMEIAEHVLPQHFIDVPQVVLPLVREAILKVKEQSEVHVRVSPENFDLVLMARSEFQSLLEGQAILEVHSDEDLNRSDVIIETPNGNVDARLSTQLELVRKSIQDAMQ